MKKEIDQLIECQGDILSDDAVIMLYKIRKRLMILKIEILLM